MEDVGKELNRIIKSRGVDGRYRQNDGRSFGRSRCSSVYRRAQRKADTRGYRKILCEII